MDKAVCWQCVEDEHLKKIIKDDGEPLECTICQGEQDNAFSVERLGKLLEPIMREHFCRGQYVRRFGENDNDWWAQEGEPLSYAVQSVLGQYFDFEEEIVDAVIGAEDVWPQDGDEAFFDDTCNYVETRVMLSHYYAQWEFVLLELKHKRRFFSSSAQTFFAGLFDGVESMRSWNDDEKKYDSVVCELAEGAEIFRARICDSHSTLKDIYNDPFKQVGPPPVTRARAGRMNADGVVVLYGATDVDTCLAEMRPALGADSAIIALRSTKSLRLLDFSKLERSHSSNALSYFQSNFTEEVEKRAFLRRLHKLISQPIIPGRESDYLITQTMAEYLGHVHQPPFDGILFESVQRAGGTNVVVFPDPHLVVETVTDAFPLIYVDGSVKLFTTELIQYRHRERDVNCRDDGPFILHHPRDDSDDDWRE